MTSMTFAWFVLSLICLCVASLAAFIAAFRYRSWPLLLFVPVIALCGSVAYFSYTSVLGFPVKCTWENLPDTITVVFFKVKGQESITLWLLEDRRNRMIELPWRQPAEDGLEGERGTMGQGTPVTFQDVGQTGRGNSNGDGDGNGDGQGQPGEGGEGANGNGDGNGEGELGDGMPGDGNGPPGWRYVVKSYGEPIPGDGLPPKNLAPQR